MRTTRSSADAKGFKFSSNSVLGLRKETTETAAPASGAPGKYVPPSLRGATEKGGKGKGKGGEYQGQQDATLRAAWSNSRPSHIGT